MFSIPGRNTATGLILLTLTWLGAAPLAAQSSEDKDPKALVERMVRTIGGKDALYKLKDVQYTYIYQDAKTGKQDVSTERYIFDGELSWAEYHKTDCTMPDVNGTLVQSYDGKQSWTTLDGQPVEDPKMQKRSDFLRKTNYYWFAMMFKLLDPGMFYKYKGTQQIDGITYDLVEVGFETGIGDAQDTYVLYINPYTHIVDQFLFTVMDFGVKDPLLMRVKYQTVDGVMLPSVRHYTPSNWEAEPGDKWMLEIMQDIKFNNGFKRATFSGQP
ncbi:hypothetical protein SCOR_31835 [Sulfidibacter corallicola]|uniref:Outer membrane lipoprotein-sorting protein n=1 Tax=Sulfidibacter corallicola TaxID=2818388 RepID=A0A8A4TIJ5_SULCO|nr:hypothetical protein [Sulfidibacter corallicola]QTD49859.1 hypothetical protein J3U87_30115 [Sulfidibacter corallicola]